jgi:glucose/arabinose dehydrogenase
MRWSDYLGTLPAAEQMRLVNWLTLGFGQLTQAVHLSTQNALVAAVLGALEAAADLLEGSRLLAAPAARSPVRSEPSTPAVPAVRWQPFLAGLSAADRAALLDGLTRVVQQARHTGELMLTDQAVETVTTALEHVTAGLAESRACLLTLVRRYRSAAAD